MTKVSHDVTLLVWKVTMFLVTNFTMQDRPKIHTVIGGAEDEVGDSFLIEADVPSDDDVVLRLGFLQFPVIICLQFHQGPEDVLILVGVFVPA